MKTFDEQLKMIAGGTLNEELTQALADVLEFIDDPTKTGSPVINISMKFSPQSGKAGQMVKIAYQVSVKWPKEKPQDFTMFMTEDGNLELNNPKQGQLFKSVKIEQPKPEVIPSFSRKPMVVNQETGEIQNA